MNDPQKMYPFTEAHKTKALDALRNVNEAQAIVDRAKKCGFPTESMQTDIDFLKPKLEALIDEFFTPRV